MFSNPKSFLSSFAATNEPFAVLEDRIWLLEKADFQNNNYLCYSGEFFLLQESVYVPFLERDYYEQRREEVEREASRVIKQKLVDPLNRKKTELESLDNLFSRFQDDSVERFIMVDVFNAYHTRYNPREVEEEPEQNAEISSVNIPELSLPQLTVSDLTGIKTVLSRVVGERILCLNSNVFSLVKNSSKNPLNTHLLFKGKRYELEPLGKISEIESAYQQELFGNVERQVLRRSSDFQVLLEQLRSLKKEREERLKEEQKKYSLHTSYESDEIGFRKTGFDTYEVYIKLNPFIIKKNNEYYAFRKQIRIGTTLAANGSTLRITAPARVLTPPYHHPFVRDDNSICYLVNTKKDRWSELGISFEAQDFSDKKNRKRLAKQVALTLNEGAEALTRRYRQGTIPVKDLTPENFPEEYLPGGRSEAESLGLKIYDNDFQGVRKCR
ncbi:MAG: hypothetical protein D6797_07465 [Bdellovibrio sp.]|nr:MAG: hypothetical protein D6797_07465 [Bdellovibrio sp.]